MILGQAQQYASPEEALSHFSETPWSNWTKADYTLEQWHSACLVHTHDGEPTSKSQCKLPVKTPDGALNRHGVHAAAAALAGARGGLKGVSDEQKQKAAAALRRYYSQLDEEPPESLAEHAAIDFRGKPGLPSDVLSHYGVKGMRWGVRKQEETSERSSTGKIESLEVSKPVLSERKQRRVEKFMKRADVMGARVSELKLKNEALEGARDPVKRFNRFVNKQDIKTFERAQERALLDAEAVQQGKLTSGQKKAIIGAVAVGAILAVGVGTVAIPKGQQSGALNSAVLRSKAFLKGQKTPFGVDKNLSKPMSSSELLSKVAKPVNPGYAKAGGKMNCRRSTYAYELRRRGFDVHATTSSMGWGQSESGVINALTPGSRNFYDAMSMSQAVVQTGKSSVARGDKRINPVKKILLDNLKNDEPIDFGRGGSLLSRTSSSSKRVLEELAKQPNGSRGEVLFKFPGFGHSMAYEVVDGVPHIFDSQKGQLYNAATKMVESKWDGFTAAEITRLDNVNLDLNFLSRWATNVGSKPQAPRASTSAMAEATDAITLEDANAILRNLGINIPGVNK